MEIPFRSLRIINRLLRKPFGFSAYRCVSNAAVKEEACPELLNSFNQDIRAGGAVPVFRRALLFPSRIALQDDFGTYTYATLYRAATALSKDIGAQLLGETEYTISYMCSNDASHIVVQWAIWMTGNIAVPLTPLHPAEMLKYYITDSGSNLIICLQDYEKILRPVSEELKKPLLVVYRPKDGQDDYGKESLAEVMNGKDNLAKVMNGKDDLAKVMNGKDDLAEDNRGKGDQGYAQEDSISDVGPSNMWYGGTEAMLIYTSGTTSKPKGVVWTHNMLTTQIASLQAAWQYSASDVVLHTLPLHHIHGQLNSLNASLAAGARIRMLPSFASHTVWARLLGTGDREDSRVSVFHGVPAMYTRLAADYDKMFADKKTQDYVRTTLSSKMRLMCAGSAALPETLFKKWEQISGIRLLERYGMSECGMALSNPYRPVEGRTLGCVGSPLPGVSARLATVTDKGLQPSVTVESPDPDTRIYLDRLGLTPTKESFEGSWKTTVVEHKLSETGVFEGELLLKGPAVFSRYWNRAPQLDSPDFTEDDWFRTGDTASFSDGRFKILGRTSVDIIKTGGYKVSALQVESAILEHPSVADAAVLGIDDNNYGEIIATVIVLKEKATLDLRELKDVAGKKLAPYQLPRTMLVVDVMPRNAMGKLDKKEIKKRFGDQLIMKKK
ncbi:malonate--CoA ligase ACSF3, mitochondrial [Pararge aegeria]|uniref:Jg27632 protein n=1 Tax=Pararge aegeria aegeria TaxID=348720 RepID=A0A8S4S6I6_9NEOP|nr:malonate--CoA ligase ACSF3, mitochondrial [Pararge aegeria]XP_039748943.1 malonate--CoA ligase ACSF3, mitochondrial [Pararge aegeria]CAH2246360.1 jg27632 [Pararge aegeria aegeria]